MIWNIRTIEHLNNEFRINDLAHLAISFWLVNVYVSLFQYKNT